MGVRKPRFGDGNQKLQRAIELLEDDVSIPEVSRITGYAECTVYKIKSGNFGRIKKFDEMEFHKEWTETVNKFRKAAGLPLFKMR